MTRDSQGSDISLEESIKNKRLQQEIWNFKKDNILRKIEQLIELKKQAHEPPVSIDVFKTQLVNFERDPFNPLYSRAENVLDLSFLLKASRGIIKEYYTLLESLQPDLIRYHNMVRALVEREKPRH